MNALKKSLRRVVQRLQRVWHPPSRRAWRRRNHTSLAGRDVWIRRTRAKPIRDGGDRCCSNHLDFAFLVVLRLGSTSTGRRIGQQPVMGPHGVRFTSNCCRSCLCGDPPVRANKRRFVASCRDRRDGHDTKFRSFWRVIQAETDNHKRPRAEKNAKGKDRLRAPGLYPSACVTRRRQG